jgi:hypothetical protein
MSETRTRTGKLVTLAAAVTAPKRSSDAVHARSAQMDLRQIYLGGDFGNGFGIDVGQVPSAYNPCPTYGWLFYLGRCVPAAPTTRGSDRAFS